MSRKNGVAVWMVLSFLAVGLIFTGCSSEPSLGDRLVGTWRYKALDVHTTLTFRANGSWKSTARREAATAKVIEKTGEATGFWSVEDNRLTMDVEASDLEETWEPGAKLFFNILEIQETKLPLESPSGVVTEWKRLVARSAPDENGEIGPETVALGPIVINLAKRKMLEKERYICADMELVVEPELTDPDIDPTVIHPRIREQIVFFLGARIYKEVNSLNKVQKLTEELFTVLRPHLPPGVIELKVNRVVVTGRRLGVEEFLSEYAVPAPAPEEGEGEAEQG